MGRMFCFKVLFRVLLMSVGGVVDLSSIVGLYLVVYYVNPIGYCSCVVVVWGCGYFVVSGVFVLVSFIGSFGLASSLILGNSIGDVVGY